MFRQYWQTMLNKHCLNGPVPNYEGAEVETDTRVPVRTSSAGTLCPHRDVLNGDILDGDIMSAVRSTQGRPRWGRPLRGHLCPFLLLPLRTH